MEASTLRQCEMILKTGRRCKRLAHYQVGNNGYCAQHFDKLQDVILEKEEEAANG